MAATMNDNLQGKVTILKSGLEGLGIAAYEKFKTPITNAVDNIITVIGNLQNDLTDGSLSGALEKIATGFGNMVEKASEIVAAVLPAILEGLGWIADNGEAVVSILAGIGAGFVAFKVATLINAVTTAMQGFKIATAAAEVVQKLMNITMAANPMILLVEVIAAVVAAIVGFVATNEDARAVVAAAWEKVKSTVKNAIDAVVKLFQKVVNFVKDNWQGLLLFLVNPFAGAFKLIYDNCEWFREIINNITEKVKAAFAGVVTFLKNLPSEIWNAIVSTVDAIREWALGLKTAAEEGITQLVTNVVTFFSELPNKIAYVIGFCLGHILKFGIDLYTWATTEIPKFVKSIITFMQQLPGKIWNAIIDAVQKIATWGEQMRSRAVSAATSLISQVFSTLSQMPGKVWNAIVGALQQVANWGTQLAAKGAAAAKGLFDAVVNGVSSLPGKMAEIGSNIVSGIWNGISSGWSWLKDKVSSLARSLLQGAKDALGIKSPSRLFRDLVGKMIPQGIGVGIDEELPTLQDDLQKGLQGMTAKVAAEVNPVAAVKNTAKVIAIDKNLDTKKVTANNEITVIVNTTNTTTLDKKVIAKEVKKEVVKGITKDQNDKDKTKGAA